jgi:hypothetical protein
MVAWLLDINTNDMWVVVDFKYSHTSQSFQAPHDVRMSIHCIIDELIYITHRSQDGNWRILVDSLAWQQIDYI